MPYTNKLTIKFGRLEHHWLPVLFCCGDFQLDFEASPVMTDPIIELADCLLLITQRIAASTSWFLEPLEYHFYFSQQGEDIRLSISESVESEACAEILSVVGSFEQIVLPFWRAIKAMDPIYSDEINWSPLPVAEIARLDKLIHSRKQEN